ncbi:Protein transport protein Y [Penicillium capsulatum]|uniref:Protein transport protein Y n=1 Tax=Penicillium capsulatum TaxID=69766 RepID=A0A9W9IC60_9EURO|nr:Protein transport protein Y [Penicillium capsulatum]KAJ6135315.1 Protein transport protein Y [Penicillium capsulatum]
MLLFGGLGGLLYVIILIINAIAILSEDRFLARIGWGRTQAEPGFGASYDSSSVKAKSINLIASVRTVMRIPLIIINTIIIVYELILG